MADYPDIYADGFAISAGAFGVTLTLQRSDPSGDPGAREEPSVVVGRVRMSAALALVVGEQLIQLATAAQTGQPPQQADSNVRH